MARKFPTSFTTAQISKVSNQYMFQYARTIKRLLLIYGLCAATPLLMNLWGVHQRYYSRYPVKKDFNFTINYTLGLVEEGTHGTKSNVLPYN